MSAAAQSRPANIHSLISGFGFSALAQSCSLTWLPEACWSCRGLARSVVALKRSSWSWKLQPSFLHALSSGVTRHLHGVGEDVPHAPITIIPLPAEGLLHAGHLKAAEPCCLLKTPVNMHQLTFPPGQWGWGWGWGAFTACWPPPATRQDNKHAATVGVKDDPQPNSDGINLGLDRGRGCVSVGVATVTTTVGFPDSRCSISREASSPQDHPSLL